MKTRLFLILLAFALICAFAGCSDPLGLDDPKGAIRDPLNVDDPENDVDDPEDDFEASERYYLSVKSIEELIQAISEADLENDLLNLRNLDFFYFPVYAETRWQLLSVEPYDTSIIFHYGAMGEKTGSVLLWVSRDSQYYGSETLARIIDPRIYSNGIAPKLLEGVDGVYYKEIDNRRSVGEYTSGSAVTQFYWVYEGYYCFMKISQDLLDEIQENDPDALKGPLFELRKVVLK